jgi:hypothetical protein
LSFFPIGSTSSALGPPLITMHYTSWLLFVYF